MTLRRQIVTPAVLSPLSEAELGEWCRTLGVAESGDLLASLLAATGHVETVCDRAFLTQTWNCFADGFPCAGEIVLPLGWLQSVTHLKYYDTAGAATTVSAATYGVDLGGDGYGRILLEYGQSWPTATLRNTNPIEIQFVAGKASAADLPAAIRHAIRLLGAAWYEHREEIVLGNTSAVVSSKLAVGVDALLANWRLY